MAKSIKVKKTVIAKPVKTKTGNSILKKELTAKNFIAQLKNHQSDAELKKIQRYLNQGRRLRLW
jgi:hypothetical protein